MLGLRTCIYKVVDLKKATDWYSRIFEKRPYFNEPYYVGFDVKGYELGLMPVKDKSNHISDRALAYWGVENIEEKMKIFIDNGATIHEKPYNVGGPIMVASVIDLWGNVIGLIYNPDFKVAHL